MAELTSASDTEKSAVRGAKGSFSCTSSTDDGYLALMSVTSACSRLRLGGCEMCGTLRGTLRVGARVAHTLRLGAWVAHYEWITTGCV